MLLMQPILGIDWKNGRLARATLELLAEEEELNLVVDGQHTGTCDTTQDIGTGTLEEGANTFSGNDLGECIDGRLVLDGLVKIVSTANHTNTDFSIYLPHQKSSSYDDGQCQEDKKQYQHQ